MNGVHELLRFFHSGRIRVLVVVVYDSVRIMCFGIVPFATQSKNISSVTFELSRKKKKKYDHNIVQTDL